MSSPAERYRKFQSHGGVADLSDRVQLVLTGADRVRYLNGQVSSNVIRLAVGQTQPACVTTPKGRLCADIMITAGHDSLRVDADASLRETLAARLERYIIADDVTLTELPPDSHLFHFAGCHPSDFGIKEDMAVQQANRFGCEGWDLWADSVAGAELWQDFVACGKALDETLLETIRIERGVPRWGRELDENTLPPEAGLDRTHIDYHKGCYVGQEVISRLKSVGHVNRELLGFIAEGDVPLHPGMHVFTTEEPDKKLGQLTSAAWSFALEKPIALGYLKRGSPRHDLTAGAPDSPAPLVRVAAQSLPFVS